MPYGSAPDEPLEEPQIRRHHQGENRPSSGIEPPSIGVAPHERGITGEPDERPHGEGQLQAQNHLGRHQQLSYSSLTQPQYSTERRYQRERTGDETTLPTGNLQIEKPLHQDLSGYRAGQRRALTRGQQCDGEQQ